MVLLHSAAYERFGLNTCRTATPPFWERPRSDRASHSSGECRCCCANLLRQFDGRGMAITGSAVVSAVVLKVHLYTQEAWACSTARLGCPACCKWVSLYQVNRCRIFPLSLMLQVDSLFRAILTDGGVAHAAADAAASLRLNHECPSMVSQRRLLRNKELSEVDG